MKPEDVVIVEGDMITPYGYGSDRCWDGLMSHSTAIRSFSRFDTQHFQSQQAGVIPDLEPNGQESVVMQMLRRIFENKKEQIPSDAFLFLSTTTGEIDYLEQAVLKGGEDAEESNPSRLLKKVERLSGVSRPGLIVSAACCSSSAAIIQGAAMIQAREEDCVLIVACDEVSEFVFSGFSSLLALDPDSAAPFDQNRKGLSVGEAAGAILLMSKTRAAQEGRTVLGEIKGWGLSNDANHMTGPSRDGAGLAKAIQNALVLAKMDQASIASISAHGTGTLFNDAMEMKAFKTVFKKAVPTYSIKGALGHTMGAAGLIEVLIALRSLHEKKIPATIGVKDVAEDAQGWVYKETYPVEGNFTLSTNSGFGGVNSALILKR